MSERDLLIDNILNEINANRGVPYEKRTYTAKSRREDLINAILAESKFGESFGKKTTSQSVETMSAKEPSADHSVDAKQAQGQKTFVPKEQPTVKKETGEKQSKAKKAQILNKKQKEETVSQLPNKKGEGSYPCGEAVASKETVVRSKMSGKGLEPTAQTPTDKMKDVYEPTRAVVMPPKKTQTVANGNTIHFRGSHPEEITGQVRLDGFESNDVPEVPAHWENEFVSDRQEKIKQFKVTGSLGEEPALTHEDDGDYHTVADANPIKFDLLARRRHTTVKLVITAVLLVLSVVFTVVDTVDITNGLLGDNPVLLLGLYLGVLIVAIVSNFRLLWGGFTSLFSGGDQDSVASLGMVAALLQGSVMLFMMDSLPTGFAKMLMGCPALFCLFLNLAGKRVMFTRIYRNLNLVGTDKEKYAVSMVAKQEEAYELGRGLTVGIPKVAFARKAVDLQGFIYHSYAPDRGELSARLPMLLSPLFGLLGGLVSFLFLPHVSVGEGILWALSGFCGGICACLPMTVLISGNVPMNRFCGWLFRKKVMLSGYDAVEQFAETDVLTLEASQLFPSGSITLKSLKSAAHQSLDRSILDVAGVLYLADSPLKPLFENIIEGKTNLLPQVDTLVYEEEMGISGWVMGYRVLVGTKKLMETHGIAVPDTDFEEKYNRPGLKAVYLSSQGVLSAVFLVQYVANPRVKEALQRAVSAGLSLHVYSCDPNVTREMICRMFRLPSSSVRVMGAVPRRLYQQQMETEEKPQAILSYQDNAAGFCHGVASAIKLGRVIKLAAILQTLFVLLGALLFMVGLYLLGTEGLSGGLILLYHLLASLLVVGIPSLLGK